MALQDYLPNRGAPDWDVALRNALDQADALIAGKAEADHTHGEGGAVAGIGDSASRPAVADGYIHSETDKDQLVVLNADGSERYRAVASDEAMLFAMIFAD